MRHLFGVETLIYEFTIDSKVELDRHCRFDSLKIIVYDQIDHASKIGIQ